MVDRRQTGVEQREKVDWQQSKMKESEYETHDWRWLEDMTARIFENQVDGWGVHSGKKKREASNL